jgi:quinol monooxygenase YgiN
MAPTEKKQSLIVVHVHVRVKTESVEAFRAASIANARASLTEPGVARFDVLQASDQPTNFLLSEVYRSPEAPAAHKETAHYQLWRDTVAPMMAEPRAATKFVNAFPDDDGW